MELEDEIFDEITTPKIFQSVSYLFVAANALKIYGFYIMFRVFILADSIYYVFIMTDIFSDPHFLNNLFIFRLIEDLLCIVKIYFFIVSDTPNSLAIANSTRLNKS